MRTRTGPNGSADKHVKEIKRKTLRKFSAEESEALKGIGSRETANPDCSGWPAGGEFHI